MEHTITVWITKYALTDGITKAVAKECAHPNMISVKGPSLTQYFHNDEWHYNEEKAVAKANLMRDRKIASLKKSLEKFEALSFSVKGD